jgi:hypothetical protein
MNAKLDRKGPGYPYNLHFDQHILGYGPMGEKLWGSAAHRPRNQPLPETGTVLMVVSSDNPNAGNQEILSLGNASRINAGIPQLMISISPSRFQGSMRVNNPQMIHATLPSQPGDGTFLPQTLITFSYSYERGTMKFSRNGGITPGVDLAERSDLTDAGPDYKPGKPFDDDWLGSSFPRDTIVNGVLRRIPENVRDYADARIYEFAFINGDDAQTIENYECYLANRWGITHLLPPTHRCIKG